jgi:hypothetical protein
MVCLGNICVNTLHKGDNDDDDDDDYDYYYDDDCGGDDDDDDDNNNNNNNCDAEDPAQDFYFVNASNYKLTSLTLEGE